MLDFFIKAPLFSTFRVAAFSFLQKILARRNMSIVSATNEPQRAAAYDLIRRIREETQMVLLDCEAYNIYASAERTQKISGVIAEVGVFRGGSARLICEVKQDRDLHLFDTFAGLPETSSWDPEFKAGSFASSYEEVQRYLKAFPKVHFHRGFFPATAEGLENLRFSFVHLDVDLYESTCSGLAWFYPRLNRGGILLSHDFVNAEGVRKAFEEFFRDKPECLLELSGTQVAIVKL